MNLIEGEAPLRKKTQTLLFGVGAALLEEFAEVGKVAIFFDGIERFGDLGFGQLEGMQTGLDLKASPALVRHLIMHIRIAETGVIEKVPFV